MSPSPAVYVGLTSVASSNVPSPEVVHITAL